MVPATVVCAIALAILMYASATGRRWLHRSSKPVASAAFVAIAIAAGAPGGSTYAAAVLAGLVLGAGGDVALMYDGKRAFLAGLGLFLLGHLAYVAACASLLPAAAWVGGGTLRAARRHRALERATPRQHAAAAKSARCRRHVSISA